MSAPLGLSVGATTLVALRAGQPPVSCDSVPTRPDQPAPDMGALADALDALGEAAGYGAPVVVAVPAYWTAITIDALRTALIAKPRLSPRGMPPTLVTDTAAAVTALGADPGLPKEGILALCDVDGTASITLINAGAGFAPISGTVQHSGPSAGIADTIVATLARDQVPAARLTAVALTGAGADIPAVGARLSQQLQVQVVTPDQPACTAAAGALLMAGGRLPDLNVSTPSVIATPAADLPKSHGLAWSEDDSGSGEPLPYSSADYTFTPIPTGIPRTGRFPKLSSSTPGGTTPAEPRSPAWFKRPVVLLVLAAALALAATGGLAYTLSGSSGSSGPATTTTTSNTMVEPAGGQ